ncbi:MAG TPA: asparagine synthase (glutamine-hydrolyzing) [Rubrivivax sp.]|nr:asparagine synthase (glutamine-hydrolyzing) [Rubrivivax sp.]
MCGVAGFLQSGGFDADWARAVGRRMGDAIAHRGPDDADVWCDAAAGILLSHRRLSVVDLSAAGHQPMRSRSGRYEVIFNGEIFNHTLLRAELGDGPWRGHSDTETMLAGFERWGIEGTLRKLVGMFAIALWDRELRRLTLARDRFGEKPLYIARLPGALLFASELKAFDAWPGFAPTIDRGAVALLLRHSYIPAPYSIFEGVSKLPPATLLHVDGPQQIGEPQAYWSLREVAERGQREAFVGGDDEAVDALERHLDAAIALQRVADVPLGAFLSGGVDSSVVVSLMQRQSTTPVRSFTIGFDVPEFNEAEHAKAVARHLGTDHTELYCSGRQALEVVPRLASMYCEPFSDSSQIPTFLVSQLARQHVTVSLSGDGGDELFGGYTRYDKAPALWSRISRVPSPLRHVLGPAIQAVPVAAWDRIGHAAWRLAGRVPPQRIGDRAHKLAEMLKAPTPEAFYRDMNSHQPFPERVVLGAAEPPTTMNQPALWPPQQSFDERMMFIDMLSYLPDDILVKVDRAAMAVSLETRVPLLDHRLVEFAWSLPLRFKRRDGVGKWLLRQVLYRHVPRELIERPKTGFGVPLSDWLRGPLRGWAEHLLDEKRLREQGLLDVAYVLRLWREQINGQREWKYLLWDVLTLQAWLDTR